MRLEALAGTVMIQGNMFMLGFHAKASRVVHPCLIILSIEMPACHISERSLSSARVSAELVTLGK